MRKSIILAAALLSLAGLPAFSAKTDPMQEGARSFERADYPAALAAWRPLAIQGNPVAQNNLAILYLDGKGVPQNTSEAVRYLSLSAASGSALGQNNLGGLYRDGKAVPRDYARAARWFAASAAQGNSAGMYNLGLMYELGQGMKADAYHAYMWYALAAEQNAIPNAAAHRDTLYSRMPAEAQKRAHDLVAACKSQVYKGCK